MDMKYEVGQKVACNGNPDGVITEVTDYGMYVVRLRSGNRIVGEVCVSEHDLDLNNKEG